MCLCFLCLNKKYLYCIAAHVRLCKVVVSATRGSTNCMQEARRCPSLVLALLSLSLTLQAVPATHEYDSQPQACATGSWWRTPLDRRASAVAAVRLPAGRV